MERYMITKNIGTKEDIKNKIQASGKYTIYREIPIPYGTKLLVNNGTVINCYTKGTYNLQGKDIEPIYKILTEQKK